jgi:hypothetical protein
MGLGRGKNHHHYLLALPMRGFPSRSLLPSKMHISPQFCLPFRSVTRPYKHVAWPDPFSISTVIAVLFPRQPVDERIGVQQADGSGQPCGKGVVGGTGVG